MAFEITTVNINFAGGQISRATVYFAQTEEQGTHYVSGNTRITGEEYLSNTGVDELQSLVKSKVIGYMENPEAPPETGEETPMPADAGIPAPAPENQ